MDPDQNLREQLALAAELIKYSNEPTYRTENHEAEQQCAYDLAERVQALDAWIRGGGFVPRDWQRKPDVAPLAGEVA